MANIKISECDNINWVLCFCESSCRHEWYVIQHGRDFPDLISNGCKQRVVDRTTGKPNQERIRNVTNYPVLLLQLVAFLYMWPTSWAEVRKKKRKKENQTWIWRLLRSQLDPWWRGPRDPHSLEWPCVAATHLPPKSGLRRMSYPFSNLSTVVLATDIPLLPVVEL